MWRDAESIGQRGLWGKKEQLWDHMSHDRLASFSGHLYLRTPSCQRLHPETSEPESSPHSSLSVPPQPQSGNKSCGLPLQNRSRISLLVNISASTMVALTITASHCVLADASSRSPSSSLAAYRHSSQGPRLSPVPPLLSSERLMTFHLLRVKAAMDWMVVSPQIHMLNPYPPTEWCLWETIRFRWGRESGALTNGISALLSVPSELASPVPSTRWGYREKSAVWHLEEGLHQNSTKLGPWFWTSSLQNCEKEMSVVYKPPACGALLQQPELTKTQGSAKPCRNFFPSHFIPVLESDARSVPESAGEMKRDTVDWNMRGACPWDTGQPRLRAELSSPQWPGTWGPCYCRHWKHHCSPTVSM